MQGFFVVLIVFVLVLIMGVKIEGRKKKHIDVETTSPPEPPEYDIVQHPNGQFSPTYKGKYCFLTSTDQAITVETPNRWVLFNTKQEALAQLEKWKMMKGFGSPKSVGLTN